MLAAVLLHCQCAVGVDLPAQDLAVLHSEPTGFAALRPLPYIPESWAWEEVAGLLFWNGLGAAVTVTLRYLLVSDSVDAVENWVL